MPDKSRTPVIVAAARTPIGKFLGALASLSATDLGAVAIREAVKRSRVAPDDVDEVIMGHVIQGGTGGSIYYVMRRSRIASWRQEV